jgi:hypothetical protein
VWIGHGVAGVDGRDQREYVPPPDVPLHHIDHLVAPERSVAVHAAIVAAADAYVGTYGGLAYIGPAFGVRSVTLAAVGSFFPPHRGVAEHVFGERDSQLLTVINAADQPLLRRVLGLAGRETTPAPPAASG